MILSEKKPHLISTILGNYQLTPGEMVAGLQFQRTLEEMDYLDPWQSGYRAGAGLRLKLHWLLLLEAFSEPG